MIVTTRDLVDVISSSWRAGMSLGGTVDACRRNGHRVTAEQVRRAFVHYADRWA